MIKNKKIILLVCICLLVIGSTIMIGSSFIINNKTKNLNTSNSIIDSEENKEDIVDNQIKDNVVENEEKEDNTNSNSSKIELYPKKSTTVNYNDLSDDEKLLYDFGFYEKIGCGNIFSSTYSDEFKMVMALNKVDKSKYIHKKCSELYSESQLNNEYYKTKYGICGKNTNAALVPYEEANTIYKKMYGTNMKKTGFTTLSMDGMYYNFFDYNESLNSYVFLRCGGCGGSCGNMMSILKIKSSNEINNKKYIEVYGYSGDLKKSAVNNNEILVLESRDHRRIELNAKDYESAYDEILREKLDKLDVYEIIFNKKDGNYIFESFVKKMS